MYKKFLKILTLVMLIGCDNPVLGMVPNDFMDIIYRHAQSLEDLQEKLQEIASASPEARLFLREYYPNSNNDINEESFNRDVRLKVQEAARYIGGIWYGIGLKNPTDIRSLEIAQMFFKNSNENFFFDNRSETKDQSASIMDDIERMLLQRRQYNSGFETLMASDDWQTLLSRLAGK